MIHRCRVECHKHDPITEEIIDSVESVWLPFSFLLDTIVGTKAASNDPEDTSYGCTTIYMEDNRSFIIDTPFEKFEREWSNYMRTGEVDDIDHDQETEL